jgi:hypothetical protein
MNRFLTKICFLLILLFLRLNYADGQTQQRIITPLNKHFFQAHPLDSSNHTYTQIYSPATNSTKIYAKSNRLVKSIEDDINPEGGFNQRTIKRYDSLGRLSSNTIKNLDDHNFITYYIESDTIRGEMVSIGNSEITITRANRPNPYQVFWNDFEPRPKVSREEWYKFLVANLNYPTQPNRPKETGTVYIALLIDKEGQVLEKELANPENVPKVLAWEAMRVINLYPGGFFSALDTDTHHSTQWAYIPIRFSLGGETPPCGNAEFDLQGVR